VKPFVGGVKLEILVCQAQRHYKPSREASASEILSMLEKLTNSREGKRRMRYGLF
jgi:hypothetical protein